MPHCLGMCVPTDEYKSTKQLTNLIGVYMKNRFCFTTIADGDAKRDGLRVAKVIENERGYYPLGKQNPNDPHELDKWFSYDADHIVKLVKSMNENMGHTQQDVDDIVFSSVRLQFENE